MRKIIVSFALLFLYVSASEPASTLGQKNSLEQLYDCTRKLHQVTTASNIDYNLEFLSKDMFYVLDRREPELYLFTPYYAGRADLSPFIKKAIRAELNKNARQVKDQSFPFTACCQKSLSYNMAIPYAPSDPSQEKGYFYLSITDAAPGMYDEVYWIRADQKMHIQRHDEPFMKTPQHNARSNGLVRFLPGPLQTMPDFTHYKPKGAENGITVTSVTGQIDKGIEYYPLAIKEKLWDKNASDNFSEDAKDILLSHIRYVLHALPPIHAVGQRADCWGHAGCDYTYSMEWVAREQRLHDEAVNSCKPVADQMHADIFSPLQPFSIEPPSVQPKPKLTVLMNGVSHYGGNYTVFLKIQNSGNVDISRVGMREVTLNNVSTLRMPDSAQLGWLTKNSYTPLGFTFPESAGDPGLKVSFKIKGDFSAEGVMESQPIAFTTQVNLGAVDSHERFFGSPGNMF